MTARESAVTLKALAGGRSDSSSSLSKVISMLVPLDLTLAPPSMRTGVPR